LSRFQTFSLAQTDSLGILSYITMQTKGFILADSRGHESDIDLMLRFASGDEDAFEILVSRHKNPAYRLAYRYLSNKTDAEEVALEALVRVWKSRASYEPTAGFRTWFFRIVINLCYNRLRRRRTREGRMRASAEESELAFETSADTKALTPADELSARELNQAIQKALAKLPENQRMAVILSRFEGLSYAEVGASLGTSEKAVKSLMARARATLKDILERHMK